MSGSGLMPRVPCVLPRPGTHCSMLLCVDVAIVCQCSCVSSDGMFAVPVVCDRTRAAAAVQGCAWSPRQASRPRSCCGRSRAPWVCGMTWGGRIASRLCPNRVRVRTASREKVLRYACHEVRVKVSAWYKYFRVVFSHPFGNSPRVGALCIAQFHEIDFDAAHTLTKSRGYSQGLSPHPQSQVIT